MSIDPDDPFPDLVETICVNICGRNEGHDAHFVAWLRKLLTAKLASAQAEHAAWRTRASAVEAEAAAMREAIGVLRPPVYAQARHGEPNDRDAWEGLLTTIDKALSGQARAKPVVCPRCDGRKMILTGRNGPHEGEESCPVCVPLPPEPHPMTTPDLLREFDDLIACVEDGTMGWWEKEYQPRANAFRARLAALEAEWDKLFKSALVVAWQHAHMVLVCDTCGRLWNDDADAYQESCDCGRFKQRMEWASSQDIEDRDTKLLAELAGLRKRLSGPAIVCLCGSTRFCEAWAKARFDLTLAGEIVLTIGCDTKSDDGLKLTAADKERLDELHKRKIDLCDYVLVLNVGGYIGSSTRSEIEYAERIGRPVRYLEDAADLANKEPPDAT